MSTLEDCPAGQYCGLNTITPSDCGPGTYRSLLNGQTEARDCYTCTEGKYCSGYGKDAVTGVCDAGYWCNEGAIVQNPSLDGDRFGPCPKYHYCESNAVRGSGRGSVCLPGTNELAEMTLTQADCDAVADGWYSNTIIGYGSTATMNVTECDPGYWCKDSNKQGSNAGQACKPGQKCPGNTVDPIDCPAGTFNFNYQARECYSCPAGYYCPEMASDSNWAFVLGTDATDDTAHRSAI